MKVDRPGRFHLVTSVTPTGSWLIEKKGSAPSLRSPKYEQRSGNSYLFYICRNSRGISAER
jgi:hypothetical protein